MPWPSFLPWSNSLKTRACRQLIHHYLGSYFQEKLSLDQLSIDLFTGSGTVKDVILNLNALNETLTNNNIPFEIVKAFVGEISLKIPWSSLLRENSTVEIKNLELTIRPKQTNDQSSSDRDGSFELSTMFNSMNTSMLIAQECLKNETEEDTSYQGLETFAATIDSILARVQVTLSDTIIRLEHLINNTDRGVALEIKVKKFKYSDSEATSIDLNVTNDSNTFVRSTVFTNKNFVLTGVTFFTDEFTIERTSTSMFESSENPMTESLTSSVLSNSSSTNNRMVGYRTSDPVLCLTVSGTQNIRLKLKQSDQLPGAKVEIDAQCGSVNCLLTPKQLQSLILLLSAYQKAALNSTSDANLYNSSAVNNRPMTDEDLKNIEKILAEEIRRKNFCQIGGEMTDPDFYHNVDIEMTQDPSDSMFCSVKVGMSTSIDLESSFSSSHCDSLSTSTKTKTTKTTKIDKTNLEESMRKFFKETQMIVNTKFNLKFNFLSLTLLHRDIPSSETSLREFADKFFSEISMLDTSGIFDERQINEFRTKYSEACLKDHLSFLGKPLTIDFTQQSTENCLYLDADIRIGLFDLSECLLKENTNVQSTKINEKTSMIFNRILTFDRLNENNFDSLSNFQLPQNAVQSAVQISVKNFDLNEAKIKKSSSKLLQRRLASLRPFTDVKIHLGSCQIDFDLSIIDRIYSTLNAFENDAQQTEKTSNDSLTMLMIKSSGCFLNLRFPIADLQPLSKRRPWWIQSVHKESLGFDFKEIQFQSDFDDEESKTLTINSKSIQIFDFSSPTAERKHIAQISSSNGKNIQIVVNLNDVKEYFSSQFSTAMTETMIDSVFYRFPKVNDKLPLRKKNLLNDNRQIFEVADAATIDKFLSSSSKETKINVNILFPHVFLYISDEIFLERLYNRFVNHLFMWESSVPKMTDPSNFLWNSSPNDREQPFQMCRSVINRSDSISTDEDDDDDEQDEQDDLPGRLTPKINKKKGPHALVFRLDVNEIHLAANAPFKDKTTKDSTATVTNIGEFRIDGQGLTLGIVDGYHSDVNLQYFCLLTHSASIYHNGHATKNPKDLTLNEAITRHLPELITRLPANAFHKYDNNQTMIRAAFEIRSTGDRDEGRQKSLHGAFTIEGAMLHQRILPKSDSWLFQLMDLFDLTDDEIPGYTPSSSFVDWHLEFRHCAVYYRPLYTDTRCFVAIDSLALTNTFVKNSKTTLVELNLDDWAIFLSKQKRDRHQIDLLNDFICIINGGAFEIKLCFNESSEDSAMNDPLTDIRIACNMIHIRSCSDSAAALIDLLKYVLSEGDLQQQNPAQEVSRSSTPIERKRSDRPIRMYSEETLNSEHSSNHDSSNQMLLLEEAMKEDHHETETTTSTFSTKQTSSRILANDDEDESNEDEENPMTQSQTSDVECGSVFSSSTYSKNGDSPPSLRRQKNNSDDQSRDFEFIEREIGMCRPPENGVCEVHVLGDTPIQIRENHFAKPLERNDILNAPAHLPVPKIRFSIRQISIVWYIYGGSDFAQPKPNDSHQQPVQLNLNESVRFSVTSASTASPPAQEKAAGRLYSSYDTTRLARQERGGPCRDLRTSMEFSITKARLQYETYPEEEKLESRVVFAIREFEIRDRLLARSEINKFLYLYTTEAAPRRTHADMLVVKILHSKPEGFDLKTPHDDFDNGLENNVSSQPLECEIKVSLQPLRINIDQDTLLFMRQFFMNLTSSNTTTPTTTTTIPREISAAIPMNDAALTNTSFAENPSSFESDLSLSPTLNTTTMSNDSSSTTTSSVFIKHFVFSPPCHIRIDYHGKLRNEQLFEAGPFLNLLIGLAQLAKVDIHLKRISYKRGILGYEKLLKFLLNEWLNEIRPTDVIKGIVPLSSVTQIIIGIKDLFYLPIDQYRRDGRILRGFERGASSFTTSTALALIELSSQLIRCAHFAALLCFELVSSSTTNPTGAITSGSSTSTNQEIIVRNHPRPNDIREGVTYAVNVIRQSINSTSHQLKTEAQLGRRRKGFLGVFGGLLRQMPSVAIQPIVTTTRAAGELLDGVRNQIDHDERNDDKQKFRTEKHGTFS